MNNSKFYCVSITFLGLFLIYLNYVITFSIEKDKCNVKPVDIFCVMQSLSDERCVSDLIVPEVCNKLEEYVSCYKNHFGNLGICKVFHSKRDVYLYFQNNDLVQLYI